MGLNTVFELDVPTWANYVAVNEDGTVDTFELEPIPDEPVRRWNNPGYEEPSIGLSTRIGNLGISFPTFWRGLKFKMESAEIHQTTMLQTSEDVVIDGVRSPSLYFMFNKYTEDTASDVTTEGSKPHTASDVINKIKETIEERGQERDSDEGERSFEKARDAWWTIYGKAILDRGYPLESEICSFMTILKMVRSVGGEYRFDDHLDGAAYMILGTEAAEKENTFERPCV